jgi:hypothetical protein
VSGELAAALKDERAPSQYFGEGADPTLVRQALGDFKRSVVEPRQAALGGRGGSISFLGSVSRDFSPLGPRLTCS